MSRQVVKVQKPLASNKSDPAWCIYAIDRQNLRLVKDADIPLHVKKTMRDVNKCHFEASLIIGEWKIHHTVVADPGW